MGVNMLVPAEEANAAFQRGDGFMDGIRKLRHRIYNNKGAIAAVVGALAAARGGQRVGHRQGVRDMAARVPAMLQTAEDAGRVNAAAAHQRQLRSVRANARTAGHMQAAKHHEKIDCRQAGHQLTSVAL